VRGLVGLETPHPLASFLPALYLEPDPQERGRHDAEDHEQDALDHRRDPLGKAKEPLYVRFVSAFDPALAPVFATLDSLDAYLDPRLAPEDFLEWLAGWVGFALEERWPVARRRRFVLHAVRLYHRRGTVGGLKEHVAILTHGTVDAHERVEIIESGGTTSSRTPGTPPPGSPSPGLLVRVRIDPPQEVDLKRLDALVAAAKPAHVPHRVEVTPSR
jgi:phage tail-like protein